MLRTLMGILGILAALSGRAGAADAPADEGVSVMLGLHQWLVMGGGNVAAQYKGRRLVLEYSHGQSLHLNNGGRLTLTGEERDAGAQVDMPWTTGAGVGLRLTRNLHLLIEGKIHRYELLGADRNQRLSYLTFTVGPGLFYEIHLWRGLFLQPLVRWWPTVADTLDEGASLRRTDGSTYVVRPKSLGVFANVNLGWAWPRELVGGAECPHRGALAADRRDAQGPSAHAGLLRQAGPGPARPGAAG
jgi:hypothetical protein